MSNTEAIDTYLQSRKNLTDNMDTVFLLEVNGICPRCGKPLLGTKGLRSHKYYQIAHIYPNRPTANEMAELAGLERLGANCEDLQNILNSHMAKINDYIYENKKMPPVISFHNLQYNFETRDDTGTGTSYKGLVLFDISVLELTKLPILVHDSVVLKQISDEAIEKILKKHQSVEKQVFIALDKASSYTPISTQILYKTAILHLSNNGSELFGHSWNEKTH